MCNNIEPLALALWFQRIAVIATGKLGSIENSLRHASHLVQLAPKAFRNILPLEIDEDKFEALLEAGDHDAAARQLFGPTVKLLVDAATEGKPPRAIVSCATLGRTVEATGDSAASAMLNAWANWLMTLRVEFGADFAVGPAPASDPQDPHCRNACPRAS